MQYTLHAGVNDGIDIVIDREVFSFDAVVSGDVIGEDEGDLTLIAYAGEIDFFDFSNLDFSAVIGFERVTKGAGPLSYSMDILPYGYDVPIEKVYLLAFLDVNRNGEIDGGDRIGYYSAGGYNLPTLLTIDEGEVSGIDIGFYMDVMEAPG